MTDVSQKTWSLVVNQNLLHFFERWQQSF